MSSNEEASWEEQEVTIHMIPHTHWDREWYQPFQVFRMRLVELLDDLLDLMEKDSSFRYFTLDGQSVILEDYLEIRPENEKRLKKLIQEGRILIGPWYVQSDEFLVSPESLIRNLLLGLEISRKFGEPMMIGYLPDTFGHISAMPLILNGFGIASALFGRGREGQKQEFLWRSVDGSQVLAINQLYVLGTITPPRGKGLKGCSEYLPRSGREQYELIRNKLDEMIQRATVPNHLLLMSGIDHGAPQPELPEIITECNSLFQRETTGLLKNCQLVQSTLPEYIKAISSCRDNLEVEIGEFRQQGHHNFSGTLSSRMYLKLENYACQQQLERWAEPFSALAWRLGREYPRSLLWKSWRELLLNQPHDSICGCSIDSVHQDMLTRFRSSRQISEQIIQDSLTFIAEKIDTGLVGRGRGVLVVFNPLSISRTEVAEAEVDFLSDTMETQLNFSPDTMEAKLDSPSADGPAPFVLQDERGFTVPCQILSCRKTDDFIFQKHGAPDFGTFVRYRVAFEAQEVPPCGYKTFFLVPLHQSNSPNRDEGGLSFGSREAENEFLKLVVEENGTLTLLHKETGSIYRNLNLFEDSVDIGDEYNFSPCQSDLRILFSKCQLRIFLARSGSLEVIFRVEMSMNVPKSISKDRKSRSQDLIALPIISYLSLRKGSPRLDVRTVVNNTARDHRFRVLFPTEMEATHVYAEGHFDTLKRPAMDGKRGGLDNTFPMRDFVLVKGKERSLAILSQGLTEYEIVRDPTEAIALTLFRSVGWLSRGDLLTRPDNCGYEIETPDAQCLGPQEFHYSILPLSEDVDLAEAHRRAKEYVVPLRAVKTEVHPGELPLSQSFVQITPDSLILSAIKKSEKRDSLIIRFYNPSPHPLRAQLRLGKKVQEAYRVRLDESREDRLEIMDKRNISMAVKANEVITVEIVPETGT